MLADYRHHVIQHLVEREGSHGKLRGSETEGGGEQTMEERNWADGAGETGRELTPVGVFCG